MKYELFPWVSGAAATEPLNILRFVVAVPVIVLSLAVLILVIIGARNFFMDDEIADAAVMNIPSSVAPTFCNDV